MRVVQKASCILIVPEVACRLSCARVRLDCLLLVLLAALNAVCAGAFFVFGATTTAMCVGFGGGVAGRTLFARARFALATAATTNRMSDTSQDSDALAEQQRSPSTINTTTGTLASPTELRIVADEGQPVALYFAYGANMNPSVLTGKRGVTPVASLAAEAVAFSSGAEKDENKSLGLSGGQKGKVGMCTCFCHRAGYATIAPTPGPPQSWDLSPGAHGVVHVVSTSDMEKITASETGYKKSMVEVKTLDGDRRRAVCFVSNPMQQLPTSVPPTSRYLSLLQSGAEYHGVNQHYRDWLSRLPFVPSSEAEASPARTNTPSKVLTDRFLLVAAVIAASLQIFSTANPGA